MRHTISKHISEEARSPVLWAVLSLSLALALLVSTMTSGCDEKSFGPPPRQEHAEPARHTLTVLEEPTLAVGDVNIPLPAPNGFKRIPQEHPLMRAIQAGLGNEETLLCIFERIGEHEENSPRELLQISTLQKWLNASISTADFSRIKQPWQEGSIIFNQNTLTFFEEAARTRLHDQTQFSYNLGMIDSSPLHISFLKVIKQTAPNHEVLYICSTNSLLWRQGKVLHIAYHSPINAFSQIPAVVAESVGYLQKLQTPGRSSGS